MQLESRDQGSLSRFRKVNLQGTLGVEEVGRWKVNIEKDKDISKVLPEEREREIQRVQERRSKRSIFTFFHPSALVLRNKLIKAMVVVCIYEEGEGGDNLAHT